VIGDNIMQPEEMQSHIEELERRLGELEKTMPGSMLSGQNIRDLVVKKKEDAEAYLKLFEARDWKKPEWSKWNRNILIDKYSELNVTPFSYDLSLGNQFFSVQKLYTKNCENDEVYQFEPRETIVVITKELVAIPKFYSATVWPRFGMVKQGIFQSMVKIDPTWHGKLAVAMTNLSPASVELHPGKAFATLLFYNLKNPSEADLWRPTIEEKNKVRLQMKIPDLFHSKLGLLQEHIRRCHLEDWINIIGTDLVVYGIKEETMDKLLEFLERDMEWMSFCKNVASTWAQHKHPDTGREIVWMEALGLEDLNQIVKGLSNKGRIIQDDVFGELCSEKELVEVAVAHGKPFDTIAKILTTANSRTDTELCRLRTELGPQLAIQVGATIMPRVITLMLTVLGFLSLVTFLATFTIRQLVDKQELPSGLMWFMWASLFIISIVTLICFLWLNWRIPREHRRVLTDINGSKKGKI